MTAFIDGHRDRFGVEPICRTLGVSAFAYYQRARGGRCAGDVEDERLLAVIGETQRANEEAYGYRRTWKALRRAGETAPRCRVQRLMRTHGIQGAKRRGKPWRTMKPDPNAQRARDLVKRDFTASASNRLWVGDFTYLRCWEGVVYFSFVIDVFSRMIVGWQLASNMRTDLVLDALRMALGLREPGADFELVAHTDAGSQYTSSDYTQVLDDHEVLASIGTVGDALDNALAESFVDSYKTELIATACGAPARSSARDRAVGRVVQPRSAARGARRHPTRRVRTAPRPPTRATEPASGQPIGHRDLAEGRRSAYNASTRGRRRRSRARTVNAGRERPRRPDASRSGRATGGRGMKAPRVASPTSSSRSLARTTTRKPTNPVSVKPGPAH